MLASLFQNLLIRRIPFFINKKRTNGKSRNRVGIETNDEPSRPRNISGLNSPSTTSLIQDNNQVLQNATSAPLIPIYCCELLATWDSNTVVMTQPLKYHQT